MKKKRMRMLMGICTLALGLLIGTGTRGYVVQAGSIMVGKDLVEGLSREPGYYILENSSREEISYDQISAMSETERQMAINEIYARHGRKFLLSEVQDYFNEKAWYYGTVEAASFNENVFNEYESKNIERLCKHLHYFLPGSNVRYLSEEEVAFLTEEECQKGINEIYARRGRKFETKKYRDYFEEQPWYQGTIEASSFDESVFNEYESANIQLLQSAMKNEIQKLEEELPPAESLGAVS